MMFIRPAKKEDSPAILELVELVKKEQDIFDPSYPVDDLVNIIDAYAGSGGEFFVAETEGKIVGTIGFYRVDDDFAQLRRFYVLKKYRGMGIGRKLLHCG